MTDNDFTTRLKEQLEIKIGEQMELATREAYLSEAAAKCQNPRWRLKCHADRQLVSRRLERLTSEIRGLTSLLRTEQENKTDANAVTA